MSVRHLEVSRVSSNLRCEVPATRAFEMISTRIAVIYSFCPEFLHILQLSLAQSYAN